MKTKIKAKILVLSLLIMMLFIAVPMNALVAVTGQGASDSETTTSQPLPENSETEEGVNNPFDPIFGEDDLVGFPATFRNVATAAELETALAEDINAICITADFLIDRTFYVKSDTIVYSETSITLTRSPEFAGDVFVVGQDSENNLCSEKVTFSMGGFNGTTLGELTINGNSENMTVDVVGTIVFVCPSAGADLYDNLTITNCKKVGNERTLNEIYNHTYPDNVGGAVAILSEKGTLNVYGGAYTNNSVNTTGASIYGGAFYSYSTMNVYGGLFENNSANRAGAIYCYRTLNLYSGSFKNNTASTNGGAIYLPASTSARLYLGSDDELIESEVLFSGNIATSNGGAIYTAGRIIGQDASFENNSATNGGAVYVAASYTTLNLENASFTSNEAKTSGGAVYVAGHSNLNIDDLLFFNVVLEENEAASGGAVYLVGNSVALANKVQAKHNTATSNGGVIYSTESTLTVYNSDFSGNTGSAGSAVYLTTGAITNIYGSSFTSNSCKDTNAGNAGAVYIYTGATNTLIHSCSFVGNTSSGLGGAILANGKGIVELYNITAMNNSALKGGFIYETSASTRVTVSGLTVSGNTATVGGPIIWGNTTNAKLFINKNNYVDLDVTGDLPSDYWSSAIANKLTVSEISTAIPLYTDYNGDIVDGYWDAVLVKNFDELKTALKGNAPYVKVAGDIKISETLHVTSDKIIFSTTPCTITRAIGFNGSLFAIGKDDNGNLIENGATFTLGVPSSTTADLLTIECGSGEAPVFVVASGSQMDVYDSVTIRDAIGLDGCLMNVEENATLNFFGGKFENNVSASNGVIYNYGVINVNGGVFTANAADQGGVFYNVGSLNVHGGTITQNTARLGGVVYNMGALTIDSNGVYGNFATDGGAIYVENGTINLAGATISENTAINGGAIYVNNSNAVVEMAGAIFKKNTAENGGAIYVNADFEIGGGEFRANVATNGGAIYVNDANVIISGNTFSTNEADKGGAVYVKDGALITVNDVYEYGYVFEGGAIYAERSELTVSKSEFIENSADYNGGAIGLWESTAYINDEAKFTGNSAANDGGAIFAEKANLTVYGTYFKGNTTKQNGGAIGVVSGSTAKIYTSVFSENEAKKNGGSIFVSNDETQLTIQLCEFTQNKATGFGGAVAVANKATVYIYDVQASGNNANRGAYLYLTGDSSTATVKGVTVSGNTAKNGTFIYGDTAESVLNINKTEFIDETTPELTVKYWEAALYGTLKINTIYEEGPEYIEEGNEPAGDLAGAFDVSNADALEEALAAGRKSIRIVADFEIDRTFYISYGVTIFSTARHTLTRAHDFGGDIFVVGEYADGTNSMLKKADARLTLGNPSSKTSSLLTIDGNKEQMTVDVVGSVMFICNGAVADIYENISVINCHKVGNERAYGESYKLSVPNRVGGSVAVIPFGALNVYGGTFKNNSIRDEDASTEEGRNSTRGAVFYNESNLKIYGGLFENNQGARGGIVYNYGTIKIYGGSFISNQATISGGVYYSPNSSGTQLNIGYNADTPILFKGNTAKTSGGVIYSTFLNGIVIYGNTTFEDNHVTNGSGGAIYTSSTFTIKNVVFSGNTAKTRGGAIAVTKTSETYTTRFVHLENCTLVGNSAGTGGALSLYSGNSDFEFGSIVTINDCKFISNTATSGGAIAVERKSILTVNGTTFELNVSTGEAGAIYAIGESTTTIISSRITDSTAGSHGGAICVRSATLKAEDTVIENSFSSNNGGAIYIAYSSNIDRNAQVNLISCSIANNSADNGGAIYATRRAIENDTEVLKVSATDFTNNSAKNLGGAVLLTAGVDVFMENVSFVGNFVTSTSEGEGGAIAATNCTLEIDGGVFTKNTSKRVGGGIKISNTACVTLNNITASRNSARTSGGFIYSEGGELDVYNSIIKNNSATTGAGIYLYDGSVSNVYDTKFIANTVQDNGAAMFIYTGEGETVISGCSFERNVSNNFGGGMYISNKSIVGIYDVIAIDNRAVKGGFMYETTTNTTVTLAGLTVSGNTASNGGSIIWGNLSKAILNLDMSKYTDLDVTETLDDAYWATAIQGSLTVNNVLVSIPTGDKYTSNVEPVKNTSGKASSPVSEIFELARNSSDGYINSTYDKFPVLDNSSNFMSRGTTVFNNINGGTVTVDTFVYPKYSTAHNMTVGEALMIYQAMLYKQAYPQEEVYIDISAYRFSVQTAVNINRNSRYFGYVRALNSENYDQFGFVRVSYLLVSAAKMGIHVNVLGHREGYPINSGSIPSTFESYFAGFYNDYCDPSYVPYGTISDYLTYRYFDWTLSEGNKGGTDMMHTKLCAVSHYIDMNGVVHKNAVWTSSSNLDGIYGGGYNANWKLQTATIVSDHADIYRVSVNYLRLMLDYSYQEGVVEFQNIMNVETTKQIDLIMAGRGGEIPEQNRLVYIGTEQDDVFELYFTPFGGDILSWSETYNPYCKYLRKLYDSEDYILFTWNAAEYSGGFPLAQQMERMIIDAFHKNKNPNNKIYANMESFDPTTFDDLIVGVDIGFKSINEWPLGAIHNKDLQFSYVENGQRYYVSLLNSCNLHSGSMYYQSNSALVIKEKTCSENSVFSIIAKYSTNTDLVSHTFTETAREEATETKHGHVYKVCACCGHNEIIQTLHYGSEWIVEKIATPMENGIRYKKCIICDEIIETEETRYNGSYIAPESITGAEFNKDTLVPISIDKAPHTLEATILLDKKDAWRGGVIVGNYSSFEDENALNLEVYYDGRVRLFYITNGVRTDIVFNADVRSTEPVHLAVTVDGAYATLYVNGILQESVEVHNALPVIDKDMVIGGDYRTIDQQIFRGKIYSVALFENARSADEIILDTYYVSSNAPGVLCSKYFTNVDEMEYIGGVENVGSKFNKNDLFEIEITESTVSTIEATIMIPTNYADRAGVVFGNYTDGTKDTINLEVRDGGKLRLFYIVNGTRYDYTFSTDIRSDKPINVAMVMEGVQAYLYINGALVEVIETACELPVVSDKFAIGGDYRVDNAQFFKGTIYSLHVFSDVRTVDEIISDMLAVNAKTQGLLSSTYFIGNNTAAQGSNGGTFDNGTIGGTVCDFGNTPLTFEAVIQLSPECIDRGGIIVSNNFKNKEIVSLEVYKNGKLRLYFRNGTTTVDCRFDTDVRSDKPIHVALTIDETIASLYVNGVLAEVKELAIPLPVSTYGYHVGGDFRPDNSQYFKGVIYSVKLFEHVRSAEQILGDMLSFNTEEGLIFSTNYIQALKHTEIGNHKDVKFELITQPTKTSDGLGKIVCGCCDKVLQLCNIPYTAQTVSNNDLSDNSGALKDGKYYIVEKSFASLPKTFEFTFKLSPHIIDRGGVVFGNYDGIANDRMNVEIYTNGNPRLWYKINGTSYSYLFDVDVRSENAVHMTLTIDGLNASLYINGEWKQSIELSAEVPFDGSLFYAATDQRISAQAFKGELYSVGVFADVRTAEEIKRDMVLVTSDAHALLFYEHFIATEGIQAKGPWAGKNVTFVGDSITAGTNCDGKTYWELLQENLELGVVETMAIPGSCISATSDYGNEYDPLINRFNDIPESDLITIFMGTNDYGHDTPLGTIDDITDVSFYGALNVIVSALQEKYPEAKIVFITPLHRYGFGINSATGETHTFDSIANGAGHTLEDYVNAIKAVCEKYNLPVIDLFTELELDPSAEETREYYMQDGLHPNAAGHRLISEYLEHAIELLADVDEK